MKRWLVSLAALSLFACSAPAPVPAEQPKPPAEIPITSTVEAVDRFKKGRDLADNLRAVEAVQEFDQAVKLDPNFALALAYRGTMAFGPEGLNDLEQASAKASAASQPERLMIDALLTGRQGEFAKSEDLWKQLTDTVPGDWRAHLGRGAQLYVGGKYSESIDALNKATTINPNAGPAYNMIGYAHLIQGEAAPAIEALKHYATLNPNEPNPQDSLGEALMAGGQFADAEAAFRKAVELDPKFFVAWEGVAYTKFFAGDWTAGKDALAKGREAAPHASDKMDVDRLAAMAALAEGKTADGLKQLDALEKVPDASSFDVAYVPFYRAMAQVQQTRYRDALAQADKAIQMAESGTLPPGVATNVRRWGLAVSAAAQGLMGDAAATQKTVAALEKEAAARPDDPQLQSSLHFARGMLAAAGKDLKSARMHFDLCSAIDAYCHGESFVVSQKAGDRAGAEASRGRLTRIYLRDPVYLYVRSTVNRMTPKATN